MPHAGVGHVEPGPVQLRDEREPQRHLVAAIVAAHLRFATCSHVNW